MPFSQTSVRNRLLKALATDVFADLRPHMKRVDLPIRHTVVEPGVETQRVCFLESGLASMVSTTSDNECVEVGHIGFEGLCGAHVLLDVDQTANRTFMQVEGCGIEISVAALKNTLSRFPEAHSFLLKYVYTTEMQVAHSVVANARYSMQERLARWLLMCHDRIEGDDLPLTHDFLSLMLGVRRSGVTNELHVLEGVRAIKATRGNVRVLDREKLLDIAGGCYGVPEAEYERLLANPASLVTSQTA